MPPGVEVRRSGEDEFDAWLTSRPTPSPSPTRRGCRGTRSSLREVYLRAERDGAAAGVWRYAALWDGVLAGGAGLRLAEGVAQFAGAEHGARVPSPRHTGRAARGQAADADGRRL